jgi:hypothetical protein
MPRVFSLVSTSRIGMTLDLNLCHAPGLVPAGKESAWSSNVAESPMSRAKKTDASQLLPCHAQDVIVDAPDATATPRAKGVMQDATTTCCEATSTSAAAMAARAEDYPTTEWNVAQNIIFSQAHVAAAALTDVTHGQAFAVVDHAYERDASIITGATAVCDLGAGPGATLSTKTDTVVHAELMQA